MKYLSTFSGIGGFELGIQQAYENLDNRRDTGTPTLELYGNQPVPDDSNGNGRRSNPTCIGYSEIDKYATKIYQHHFPEHINYGDITKINADELPDFDLLVGGFPCQAFSIAGKRRGFEDTRGTMFFELARILRAKQPRLFLFENVKGLLSHDNGNTFKTIIATIDELGYDVQWQVLNSKNHGVPQNRERVFIVGHLRGTPRPEVFPFGATDGATDQGLEQGDSEVASTLRSRYGNGTGSHIEQLNNPKHSNDRIYGTDGVSPTLNTMQGGNRQPKVLAHYGHKDKEAVEMDISPTLKAQSHGHEPMVMIPEATKGGYAVAEPGDSINLAVPNSKTRRGMVGKGVAQTLDTGMQQHTLTRDMRIRRLTLVECERLQGFPDDWTKFGLPLSGERYTDFPALISDTQRYKTLGNAVTVNVIADIMERLFS